MMITNEVRRLIIEAYLKEHTRSHIASLFGVNISTVYSIIKIYEKENRVSRKQKGGTRRCALTDEHVQALQDWIDENCGLTLKNLQEMLLKTFGVTVCFKTVDNYIKRFAYTVKRISLLPVRRNTEEAIENRAIYGHKFLNMLSIYDESNVIFVDEVGFNISLRSRIGRSLRGTRAVEYVSALRNRNISVCCGMSKTGIVKYVMQTSPFNAISFTAFIDILLDHFEQIHGVCCIIMDNVPFHKCNSVKNAIESRGHSVLLLPPYSPFMNPIENMFSKWKQHIRQARATCEEDLFSLIEDIENVICPSDCASYYRHMFSFIPKCLNKEIIVDE